MRNISPIGRRGVKHPGGRCGRSFIRVVAWILIVCVCRPAWAGDTNHVIFISFDGLRGDLLENLVNTRPGDYPNLRRFVDEGATTFNARNDYNNTSTLPNHVTMAIARPVLRPVGQPNTVHHGYTGNSDPGDGVTLHNGGNPNLPYIASVFDVVHDNGLSTALYAGKTKLVLLEQSYNTASGAPDPIPPDNGRDKIDRWLYSSSTGLLADFTANLESQRFNYSFVHFSDTDSAGHGSGWGSTAWDNAVRDEDRYLGQIFSVIENDPILKDHTAIMVTADHGGYGTGHSSSQIESHTIPFLAWGSDVAAGADLYALNPDSRQDPLAGTLSYNAVPQPIRNGDGSNLALSLLGLGPIPGSVINANQDFLVGEPWATLPWDGNGAGNWGDRRWSRDTEPYFPDETTHAVVKTNTVSVAADHSHSALTLTVESGGVAIASTGALTVTEGVDVAAGAALDVGGTLSADWLTTAGTNTIGDGALVLIAGTVDVAASAALDVAGTLAADSLTTAGVNTVGDGAVLSVTSSLTLDSSLEMTGATLTTSPGVTNIRVNSGGVLRVGHPLVAAELNVAGTVQAAGADVTVLNVTDGGTLNTSADLTARNVNIAGGTLQLGEGTNLNVATMQVSGGRVNTGTGHVVVSDTLKIGDHKTFNITDATFQVDSFNLADGAEPDYLTLTGGRLAIGGGAVAPAGAVAIWKFEEGEDPLIAPDSSLAGNDHVGQLSSEMWESDDPDHGTALRFDGNQYVEVANTGDIELGNPFTIAMWMKTSQKGGKLLGKGHGDHKWQIYEKALYIDGTSGHGTSGHVAFTGLACRWIRGTKNVADGRWHHVVVTFNGNNAPGDQEIYVDGLNDTSVRTYTGMADNGDVFRLGWAETGYAGGYQEYIGLMDDVYLYDRSLSAGEVADLYESFGAVVDPLRDTNLRVTANSILHLEPALEDTTFGNLTLDPGAALKVTGAAVCFNDMTAGDGSSIQGDLEVGGVLSPADSPGTLNVIGKLTMQEHSTYEWQLGASAAADRVDVTGKLALSSEGWGWTLKLIDDGAALDGGDLVVFTYDSLAGDSLGKYSINTSDVGHWVFAAENPSLYNDADHRRVLLTGVRAVPEPGTLVLLAGGALGLLLLRRRRS